MGFEEFCGGQVLNESLLLDSQWPHFTQCFQNSVLVWVPCGWLWLSLAFYLHYLFNVHEGFPIAINKLNTSKTFISLILSLLAVVDMIKSESDAQDQSEHVNDIIFVSGGIKAASYFLAAVLIQIERNKGVITSGVLWLFWTFSLVANVIPFYSKIYQQDYNEDLFSFALFYISFAFLLVQFILTSFAENLTRHGYSLIGLKPSPELAASFPSRLTYWWINSLILQAYRKGLKEEDVFSLHPRDRAVRVVHRFQKSWQAEVASAKERKRQMQEKMERASFYSPHTDSDDVYGREEEGASNIQADELSPLLIKKEGDGKDGQKKEKEKYQASLFKALAKTYGFELFKAHLCKLMYDLLQFTSPLLLNVLIDYTHNVNENERKGEQWKGYVYASSFFVVASLASIMFHQNFHLGLALGMRVKSALIAAIYKKSLSISNEAKKESTVGEIVNLMSVDCQRMQDITGYLWMLWSAPLQITLAMIMLWNLIGVATLAGLAIMILLMPINALIAAINRRYQIKQMKFKDERIKLMNEVLNGMKVLKLYAWEPSFQKKVEEIRNRELSILKKSAYLNAFSTFAWTCAPFMVTLATFATYVLVSESHYLDAQKAFVALSLFNLLRFPINTLPMIVSFLVQASVSLGRVGKFLRQDDLDFDNVSYDPHNSNAITVRGGKFTWDKTNPTPTLSNINLVVPEGQLVAVVGQVGAGKSSLVSAILGEMEKLQGHVSVKSSIAYVPQQAWIQNATLKDNILFGKPEDNCDYRAVVEACALRADLDMLPGGDMTEIGEKGINLSGGQKQRVSLARAVYSDADIYLLDDPLSAVDSHVGKHIFDKVISDKGILRKKTRILVTHGAHWLPMVDTIVVLTDGQISEAGTYEELLSHDGEFAQFLKTYLLQDADSDDDDKPDEDDEIRAIKAEMLQRVESVTSDTCQTSGDEKQKSSSKKVKKKTTEQKEDRKAYQNKQKHLAQVHTYPGSINGVVVKGRVVRNRSNFGGNRGKNGKTRKASHKGKKNNDKRSSQTKSHLTRQFSRQMSCKKEDEEKKPKIKEKLIEEEKAETGHVKLNVFLQYFKAIGVISTFFFICLFAVYQAANVYSSIWLSEWTDDDLLRNTSLSNTSRYANRNYMYLGVYGGLGLAQAVLVLSYSLIMSTRMVRAAGVLHLSMLTNVLRSPMAFYDTTPSGRVLNRFSRDVEVVDNTLPAQFRSWMGTFFSTISTIVVISYSTPIFMVVIVPLGIFYYLVQRFYIPTSRQLKRIESTTRSPIYSHFSETITGVASIRAYKASTRFVQESEDKVDRNLTYYFAGIASNRWLGTRLEFVGNLLVLAAAMFAVTSSDMNESLVGLSISYALQVTGTLNWLVRMTSDLETNIVSVERIKEYAETETEAEWVNPNRRPPNSWPDQGAVQFVDYKTRYRPGLDLVLKGITCSIEGGEKVGIVGRTGAGKSSLTVALFRLIEAAHGTIAIDGTTVSDIGLHDLRSKITILPQDPVLFSGSLRMNLDPFDTYSDERIWRALEHAHLTNFVQEVQGGLQYECGEGGQNLSVGQRQLVCLARSLLRKTKILVLDEATAAVDMETDDLIQNTIRTEFKECTVITIAHRLNTIMDYDRIIVLDQGEIKEMDSPNALLDNKNSVFYSMAKDANLV